jgi:hypothetical protein
MVSQQTRDGGQDKPAPGQVPSHPVGPTSTQGVEARDLPDGGRGSVETDQHHEHARKLPQQTGENTTGDVGVRAFPNAADAADHGNRKKN